MSYQYRMSHVHQLQDGTWRYWRRVPPKDIAPLIGKTCWAKRLGRVSRAAAEAAGRIEDVRHDATIARLRRLSNASGRPLRRQAHRAYGTPVGRVSLNLELVNTADLVMADLDTRYAADPEYQAYLDTDAIVRSELARLRETPVVRAANGGDRDRTARGRRMARHGGVGDEGESEHPRFGPAVAEDQGQSEEVQPSAHEALCGDVREDRGQTFLWRASREITSRSTETSFRTSSRPVTRPGNAITATFPTLFNVAVDQRWIDANPMRGLKPLRTGAKVEGKRPGVYSRKQLRTVLAKIGTSATFGKHAKDVAWITELAIYHGCRVSELSQLRNQDIHTHDGITYFSVIDEAGSTKNEGSNRDIPLHPKCAAFVKFAKSKKGDAIFKLPKNGDEAGA